MYLPAHFRAEDHDQLLAFMHEHAFATLVTAPGGVPFATHLPVLVQQEGGTLYLRSHLARANKQWQHFGPQDVLVIFQGPHALIDPAWYASAPNVPTWNYSVVHAYGQARVVEGEQTRAIASGLVERFTPGMAAIPADFERRMLAGVVTFEIAVTRLEGKDKLSQNKSSQDRHNVAQALLDSERAEERATGERMAAREQG
ncbi:FMN-binding negative transcriptional regulator [Deinococcus radiodurans]|nr:FMN-binding negative transcriptional regulator [Deinococcus radiodurans]ANC71215.1 transcriptional regulator [Deinococcus radiodurans R1 = ATCC 13939 = DSM 20539]QIP29657.1 FMN-binding negative transcriptional regulator [Deinococcus radiodurans]QIP31659.1 FMN-binding negative transcriptional regulator [Deinococcus radiodurans]UID70655.1 transcriptional regulator [Deinococcus radiodurans R1 = ATCC 13939 = DSM 20539]UTA51088.1 FMN-binding negative transcriptional regulator [Deinococcus radiod